MQIPDLFLKLYFFWGVIPLSVDKMVPVSCKSNGYDKEDKYNFLHIWRCVNLLKIQAIMLKQINKSHAVATLKLYRDTTCEKNKLSALNRTYSM